MPNCELCLDISRYAFRKKRGIFQPKWQRYEHPDERPSYREICKAAVHGCPSCRLIRDIAEAFLPGTTEEIQNVALDCDRRRGTWALEFEVPSDVGRRENEVEVIELIPEPPEDGRLWPWVPERSARDVIAERNSNGFRQLLRYWLDICTKDHSKRCPIRVPKLLPKRLVAVGDTDTEPRLVDTEGKTGEWLALSYCWGSHIPFTTTSETLARRKQGFPMEDLPETLRDAIQVARVLGVPYIWIDALCIIQDSKSDWDVEAANMAYVYEKCTLLIAAMDSSNSNYGLLTNRPSRGAIPFSMTAADGRVLRLAVRKDPLIRNSFSAIAHSPGASMPNLETRAWTLQELTLAPRALYFFDDEVAWQCRTSYACECCDSTRLLDRNLNIAYDWMLVNDSYPTAMYMFRVTMWRELITRFTARKLTRISDRMPAIAGLAQTMQMYYPDVYLFGLWRSQLAEELKWRSGTAIWDFGGESELKTVEGQFNEPGYAPSWSWLSVSGRVHFLRSDESSTLEILSTPTRSLGLKDSTAKGRVNLTVKGHMMPVDLDCNGSLKVRCYKENNRIGAPGVEECASETGLSKKRRYSNPAFRYKVCLDQRPNNTIADLADHELFLLSTNCGEDGHQSTQGLLLLRVDENGKLYRRVGVYDYKDIERPDSPGYRNVWPDEPVFVHTGETLKEINLI